MNAPEVHGTYPIPDRLQKVMLQHADLFVTRPRYTEASKGFPRVTIAPEELGEEPSPMLQMQRQMLDALRQQREQLDEQIVNFIGQLPPGTRVCVHGIELMTEDSDGFRADSYRMTVRQRLYILGGDDACPSGSGGRQVFEVPG